MHFRVKRTGPYAYLQIVESFRENGQVRQRVLSTGGLLEALQESGALDGLMHSALRFCEDLAVIASLLPAAIGPPNSGAKATGLPAPNR